MNIFLSLSRVARLALNNIVADPSRGVYTVSVVVAVVVVLSSCWLLPIYLILAHYRMCAKCQVVFGRDKEHYE